MMKMVIAVPVYECELAVKGTNIFAHKRETGFAGMVRM